MTKNEANSADAADTPSSPPEHGGGEPHTRGQKKTFETLASEKQRREASINTGLRVAAGVLGAVVVLGGIIMLLPSNDDEDKSAPTEKLAEMPNVLDCEDTTQSSPDILAVCAKRAAFQDQYKRLTAVLRPELEAASAEAFVQQALTEIEQTETTAILAFDRSDFDAAIIAVEHAISASEQLAGKIAEEFASSLAKAQNAFTNDETENAVKWIERATRLKPHNADAAALNQRISVLPEVLSLSQKAAEAAVQNQRQSQYEILKEIVALDPARRDIAAQASVLGEQIKQTRYNALLRQASRLIENNDLVAARAALRNAAALYPGKEDTGKLTSQIEALEKTQRIAAMFAQASILESQDQWPGAIDLYNQILAEEAYNLQAVAGLDKATRTVSANNRAVDMLNNQQRMQDAKIHKRITEFVDQIRPLAKDSATLAKTVATLEQTLALWLQEKKVTVMSDGKSTVKVRRVGIVGVTKSKDIQLRPGNYEFECSRRGYRSKIVPHFVPPNESVSSVTVTCDVPI